MVVKVSSKLGASMASIPEHLLSSDCVSYLINLIHLIGLA